MTDEKTPITTEGKMRGVLKAAKSYIDSRNIPDTHITDRVLKEIDDALAMKSDIEDIKDRAFHAGYKLRDDEVLVERQRHAEYSQELIRAAHQKGFDEGSNHTEQRICHSQPYEIQTETGVKYGAKGGMQPTASVRITRRLEDGTEISQLIKADLNRGVEEISAAIDEMQKRGAK